MVYAVPHPYIKEKKRSGNARLSLPYLHPSTHVSSILAVYGSCSQDNCSITCSWLASLLSLFKAHTSISTINGSDIHYNYQHLVTMQFIISYNLLILLVLSLILTLILPITNNSLIIEMLQHIFCNSKC